MRADLEKGIKELREAVTIFDHNFDKHGPMVDGLSAKEASDRY